MWEVVAGGLRAPLSVFMLVRCDPEKRRPGPDLHAMKLHRVLVGEAHDRRLDNVHAGGGPRADVFHELLHVLGGDGGRGFELQYDRMVHFHVQTTDKHGDAARHGEDLNLRQAGNPPVVQLGRQHPLVEPLSRPRPVTLDDGRARALDGLHQRGLMGGGGNGCLQDAGPGHEEE